MFWSLEVIPKDLELNHVPKGDLSNVGNLEAREDSLKSDQEGFHVDDEEQRGQRVPQVDGEEDGQAGEMLEERSRGFPSSMAIQPLKTRPKPMASRTLSTQSMLTL
jgi:hypothetical protein